MHRYSIKLILSFFLIGFTYFVSFAQKGKIIDEVVAIVGDEVILHSDVEGQLLQLKDVELEERAEMRCEILAQLIKRKVLLARAKADSLKISDDQVENELNRRLEYFIAQIGSKEKLEQYYNKSVLEIKSEFRKQIRDQLLADQMQNKAISGVEITPREVRKYFNSIPEDSLPYYSTEVELSQVVIFPKLSKEERQSAIDKLQAIREDIINGASFGTKALIYSKDEGSALKRGDLGMQRADMYVPEFAAAALKLKKDSISGIVESKFGFHIIQMVDRKGDNIHVKHILIKPEIGEQSKQKAKEFLDSIRNKILTDTLTFNIAASLFSDDADTKNRGGVIIDPKANASRIQVDDLDAATFVVIDKLKVGEISNPVPYTTPDGKQGYRIVLLRAKIPPHKANIKDDYPKLKQIAMEDFKAEKLNKWFDKYLPLTYIQIQEKYSSCKELSRYQNHKVKY